MSWARWTRARPWDTRDVVGVQRFLQRLWRNVVDEETGAVRRRRRRPTDDATTPGAAPHDRRGARRLWRRCAFNTAIARLIELNNHLTKLDGGGARARSAEPLVLMVAPLAPHIAEELWARLGHDGVAACTPTSRWPTRRCSSRTPSSCVVQVNGKVRDRLEVPADITEDALRELALASPKVQAAVPDGIRTVIVRAPKLVNVVPA